LGGEVHPDDVGGLNRALPVALRTNWSCGWRKGDGSFRWFLSRFNRLHDEKGRSSVGILRVLTIDDRKGIEEKLQQETSPCGRNRQSFNVEEIVGTSPALKSVLSRVSKVAPSDSTVLITGKQERGKELVARAIHRRSDRASRVFVSVNCAAIPRDLIASELFGHEKGPFTARPASFGSG